MVKYSISFRGLLIPVVGVVILEIIWNILGYVINPSLLNIPLHIVKYILYALAGYIATIFYGVDNIGGAIYGGITGGIGAIIEGFVISVIFFGSFFYTPGFPIFVAMTHIISLILTGAVFGFLGSIASRIKELDFLMDFLRKYLPQF
jgi:hypothetical protein